MKKYWLALSCSISITLAGCAQQIVPYSGRIQELVGAQIHYEPINPVSLQDYRVGPNHYRIIENPENYCQQGVAGWFDDKDQGQSTIIGEKIDNFDYVAAHPNLPLPGYVSVTNMNNGRRLIVRLIAHGKHREGSIITLSKTAADRLMLTEQTPIQIDYITVNPDGSIKGEQATHVEAVRQSYPLPDRPNIMTQ